MILNGQNDRSTLQIATTRLRETALAVEKGRLLGSEDELLKRLGVARTTLKQAARLLEKEGLVDVKRGAKGGYFAARPTEDTLKAVASAYLHSIKVSANDIVSTTTILWLEVVRRATELAFPALEEPLTELIRTLAALPEDASFRDVDKIEQASRQTLFDALDCRYIELILRINQAFGSVHAFSTSTRDHTPDHRAFVAAWRKAKTLELQAIADRDGPLADVAARNCRAIWNDRVTAGVAGKQHDID